MFPVILYDNRFADGTPVASATAAGYDARNIRDLRTYTQWMGDAAGTFFLTVDCGAAKSADALGLAGHNLGTLGASVSVESSATGAWAGEETQRLAPFVPTNDAAVLKLFASASARYWRVKIIAAGGAPYLGVAILGARMTFPFPPVTPYVPFEESVEEETPLSETGHPLGTLIRHYPLAVRASFANLQRSFVFGGAFQTFWEQHARKRKYFFYGWDLDVYPEHVFFVRHAGKFAPPVSTLAFVDSIDLDMRGVR